MDFSHFHYAQPLWLWLLLAPVLIWLLPSRSRDATRSLKQYADEHLLPHLTRTQDDNAIHRKTSTVVFLLFWLLGTLALAGPRWDYTQVDVFEPASSVVFLLDLSNSMNVSDVKPSRLERAKQEIEDAVRQNEHLRLGLIAFASVPHVVTPVSDDSENMLNLIPSLNTDLITIQGSQLAAALDRALRLLEPESAGKHAMVLVSDGDFEASELEAASGLLAKNDTPLHVIGIGTPEGAPVADNQGNWLRDDQQQIAFSKLNESNLANLSRLGGGQYIRADFRDDDTQQLMRVLDTLTSSGERQKQTTRLWEERFYICVIPMAFILLWWIWPERARRKQSASLETIQ